MPGTLVFDAGAGGSGLSFLASLFSPINPTIASSLVSTHHTSPFLYFEPARVAGSAEISIKYGFIGSIDDAGIGLTARDSAHQSSIVV